MLCLFACGATRDPPESAAGQEVLARVGDSVITRRDLEIAMARTLGADVALLDAKGKRSLLESMVTSRVIARTIEPQLSAEERDRIARQVAFHREALLVERYLAAHSQVKEITHEMIEAYYEAHPNRFGQRQVRSYEMLLGTKKVDEQTQAGILEALRRAGKAADWARVAQELRRDGFGVAFRAGEVNEGLLDPRLVRLMNELAPGEVSRIALIDGKPYLVRIVSESVIPPRPLSEVVGDVREALVARAKRDAIKKVSEDLPAMAEVEYVDASSSP